MKKFLGTLSIIALLVWGGVFIWFFVSNRIEAYLDPSFRIFALLAGIGLVVLGLFNLMTRNQDAGVCNHEHAHGDSCDHDHSHDEGGHSHDQECDHDHHDHEHKHDEKEGCGHDHGHSHEPEHQHSHDHDTTASSLAFSLLVLLIPLLMAARYSQDRFSLGYVNKWAKIEHKMQQMSIAKRNAEKAPSPVATGDDKGTNPYTAPVVTEQPAPATAPEKKDTPPDPVDTKANPDSKKVAKADTPPEKVPDEKADAKAASPGWDEFTLDDLKKMVPQSSEGNFLLDVPQIFYTAGDDELMKVMEGIPVETTAQVMEETDNNPKKTRLRAFRLFIECCAADARPLSIPIEFGKTLPEYTEMGWYKIFGKLHFSRENDEIVPVLKIQKIVKTVEPVDGMMY